MRVLLLLYVDDMSMAYPSKAAAIAKEIKRKLAEKYKVTNLGTAKQFLGIEINSETSKQISLGQKAYITSVLKWFDMENAYVTATPMATDIKLDEAEKLGAREVDPAEYQAIVGSLMYVALATRPDILFAVSALSRYNSCPRTTHLTAAKRVLQYLKTTANHRLHFHAKDGDGNSNSDGNSNGDAIANEIIGYTDSD